MVFRPVLPPPSQPFSSTATFVIPCSLARKYAAPRPCPPPPMMMTSYSRLGSGLRHIFSQLRCPVRAFLANENIEKRFTKSLDDGY